MLYEELDDLGESGSGGQGEESETQDEDQIQTEDQDPGTGTEPEVQGGFASPALAGRFKTEQELLEFLSVQDSALKATRSRVSQLENQPARGAPEPEPEPSNDPQEFFANPHEAVSKIIQKELRGIVAPLLGDMASRKAREQWDSVAAKYPNFGTYREAVEETLRSWNVPPEQQSAELIERVFKSEVGNAALEGRFMEPSNPAPTSPQNGDPAPRTNPQHRPSSHPTAPVGGSKAKVKLTEEEKKLARIQFRGATDKDGKPVDPEAEYIKWALSENSDQHYILDEA
jgi:hypothetical protein